MSEKPTDWDKVSEKFESGYTICNVRFSKAVDKIIPALIQARKQFSEIRMDGTVSVRTKDGASFSFKYATLPEIMSAVDPALLANGLFLTQHARATEKSVVVSTILIHETGQYMASEYPVPVRNATDIKEVGAATTYGRRYSVGPILGVAAEEDTDAATTFQGHVNHEQRRQKQKAKQADQQSTTEPNAKPKEAADTIGWERIKEELALAGVPKGDTKLANAVVMYVTNRKVTLSKAFEDSGACGDALEAICRANAECPPDSKESLMSIVKEKVSA